MKLKELFEEMGMAGMSKIKNTLKQAQKVANIDSRFDIQQRKGGSYFVLLKNGKPLANIPASKANDVNYLVSMVTRYKK